MSIPDGWDVTSKEVTDERTENGRKLVQETSGVEIEATGLKHLLNFQKTKLTQEIFFWHRKRKKKERKRGQTGRPVQ